MAANITLTTPTSTLPSCTLRPQEPLLPWVSDAILAVILPTIVYAVAGAFFQLLDSYELFSNHRIHPSEDELKRNHVTKRECLMVVLRYHAMQIAIGLALNYGAEPPMVGDEACKIRETAMMIRNYRNIIPYVLTILGIDARQLSIATAGTSSKLAQVIGGSIA
ncbi:MAG: hypothetical protein Q9183_002051, partial [Haloplaca sp. 2 TL-2023]